MILKLYVHDFHQEIGHTRATIDLLNHLTAVQKSGITEIHICSFTATDPVRLLDFPDATIVFDKVPFPNLYPFIFKSIFFQTWTAFTYLFSSKKDVIHLSVGIAFLFPDIVNIQFIHHHWDELNKLYKKSSRHKRFYKWILFKYFNVLERLIYTKSGLKFIVLSKFSKDYLIKKFSLKETNVLLTYSNVNMKSFFVIDAPKDSIVRDLGDEGLCLNGIDFSRPVFLFVGAFERKGLDVAMGLLEKNPGLQFIVIGKSESGAKEILKSESLKIFYVPFTKKINFYYNLADYFIFPTRYEPFGLVILEAAITGLHILVPKHNVGASELLYDDANTTFLDETSFDFSQIKTFSINEKNIISKDRKDFFQKISWEKSASLFYEKMLQATEENHG
ncbi:MAG: glycosyltransferase family 4 protein [Bacteriovorax sp.]|nr:glycosyltransferase family 4 protein [Bacteriovorax sp.]